MIINEFDTSKKILVVAEIGNNHEGSLAVAEQLVDEAALAGVDAVKFQTYRTERFVHPANQERYARMKRFELSGADFRRLQRRAQERGLLFLSTPLDLESVDTLHDLVDAYKIASGDNDFFPLIEAAAAARKPIIVSSGASEVPGVQRCVDRIRQVWRGENYPGELGVLHCVSNYPTADEHANLRAIAALRGLLAPEIALGYSDHTLGIDACMLAAALGAAIIEKHFTLDKRYSDFRDHQLSADPPEMAQLVKALRRVPRLLGNQEKRLLENELELAPQIRRSIVAARELAPGHCIAKEDLMWLRPSGGLPPGQEAQLIGKQVRRTIAFAEPLTLRDVA